MIIFVFHEANKLIRQRNTAFSISMRGNNSGNKRDIIQMTIAANRAHEEDDTMCRVETGHIFSVQIDFQLTYKIIGQVDGNFPFFMLLNVNKTCNVDGSAKSIN